MDGSERLRATYARARVTYNEETGVLRGMPGALVIRYTSTPKIGKKGMRIERRIIVKSRDGRKWLGTFPAEGNAVELRCTVPEKTDD